MKEHYKGIGHIAIYTVDMDQSIAFYEMIGGSVFKRDGVETPEGLKKLALVEFGGFLLELIEPPAGTLVPSGEGSIPHFAVYVDDLDKTAADLKAAGVISFTAPEKKVLIISCQKISVLNQFYHNARQRALNRICFANS